MPEHFQAGDLGEWFSGNLSYFARKCPHGIEVTKARLEFPRPIRKADGLSCELDLGDESMYFTVSIPWAVGIHDKDINVDIKSKYYPKIAQIIQAGLGAGVKGRVMQVGGGDYSGQIIRFASSKSYNLDAQGRGNWTTFTLYVEYRYDPAQDYQMSNVRFKNYSAIAGNTSDPSSLTDQNYIFATIIPFKFSDSVQYDEHIYHNLLWYTTNETRTEHLMYYDSGGNFRLSDEAQTRYYNDPVYNVDGLTELDLKFPIPQEWCYAWPNQTVGWGYFTMDTWYRYTKHELDSEAPEFCLGELSKPVSYVVQTPDYIKPSIDTATTATYLDIVPSDLPFASRVNERAEIWVNNGYYVQRYCTINLHVQAQGSFGSTIQTYVIVEDTYRSLRRTLSKKQSNDIFDNVETSIQNVPISGLLAFTVYAKDSRGRYSEVEYINVPPGYKTTKLNRVDEDGNVLKINEVTQTYDAIEITPYVSPTFDFTRSYRVNDDGDISENGRNISAEANPLKTTLPNISGVDLNPAIMYFRISDRSNPRDDEWRPNDIALTVISTERPTQYSDGTILPAFEYWLKFYLDDSMTQYLNQQAEIYNQDLLDKIAQGIDVGDAQLIPSYTCTKVEKLGTGMPTIFLKRDGLGIGIGMNPETNLNYRCLEIAENWEIRHGREGNIIYYIPDVVFTPHGDPLPPKRRKGRIWLHEIG